MTAVIDPIPTKLKLVRQRFVKNCYTEIHENSADDLVVCTRLHMGIRGPHINSSSLLHKEWIIMINKRSYQLVILAIETGRGIIYMSFLSQIISSFYQRISPYMFSSPHVSCL